MPNMAGIENAITLMCEKNSQWLQLQEREPQCCTFSGYCLLAAQPQEKHLQSGPGFRAQAVLTAGWS